MKWLRLYDEFVDDPKIQNLPLELRMALVNLWCVASQNDGRFPSVDDMAFKLHFKPAKMRKILADLSAAGFIDEDETGLFPHNWRKRQFKSDDNYDRVKRFRSRNKDSPETADETFQSNDLKRPQSQSQSQSQRESHQPPKEVDTTRARSLISPEAHTIADAIGQAAGFSKENWPPGWCGLALQVQKFISEGCPGDLVRDTAINVLKRKRDGPPENFSYFDRPIATAFAQFKRPLPEVSAPDGAINGQRKRTVIDAANDLLADIDARIAAAEARETGDRASEDFARLLPPERCN